jgi:hypothetical protein
METKQTIQRVNEIKSWFFEKPLAKLTKRKRKKIQINKIRCKKGDIAIDSIEIQRITNTLKTYTSINWKIWMK